jgi:hypothetical protein
MDADLHWTEADAELARAETLALLKRECPKCPDLDELLTILRAPDIAGALGERPEYEYSIAWMPTFTDESLGDAGEDWEVLSWDGARVPEPDRGRRGLTTPPRGRPRGPLTPALEPRPCPSPPPPPTR